jgi:hypothetical protein
MTRRHTAGPVWRVGVILAAVTSLLAADATPKKTAKPKTPENKFATLEDFYGDSGTRFQAALSFYNREPISSTIAPSVNGYGIGVDDMFISWKETRLDEDTTACAGECADLEVRSTLEYTPSGLIELTVTDKSPYDPVNPKNDCNGNGSYLDAVDDQDCNDNGTTDVVVKVTSLSEVAGEIAVLDRIAPGSPVYRGRIPFTVLYDSPGSVFVQASGTANPEVTASYEDRDDGTGARCANALSPAQAGFLVARTTIAIAAGRIDYRSVSIALSPGSPETTTASPTRARPWTWRSGCGTRAASTSTTSSSAWRPLIPRSSASACRLSRPDPCPTMRTSRRRRSGSRSRAPRRSSGRR